MTTDLQKEALMTWFSALQKKICGAFEELEHELGGPLPCSQFNFKPWRRQEPTYPNNDGGGGLQGLMKGRVFEKVGVNISTVYGEFSKAFAKEIPGASEHPYFWASGISLVAHPLNPFVPAVHMNTRHVVTTKSWFGGGADLTPTFEFAEDTQAFHVGFETLCTQHPNHSYQEYKDWCDRYFYLPHRNEPRGIGGIFYDYINNNDFDRDFAFTQGVGETFLNTYVALVKKRMHMPWTQEDKEKQLVKRGRYVEFNLLYDRGTAFGLKTGGNVEGILMSMPPEAHWP
jgi:coproporphyrinogen III oxidase